MDRKAYDKLGLYEKIELFDLTDDPNIRGHLFLTTGIGMLVYFLGEKEPDPKEGPYLVLERVNPENCARLRVTAFDDAGKALDGREFDWAPRSLLDAARLDTAICELVNIAIRTIKPGTVRTRRQGHRLDPELKIFGTIKVEDVMKLVEEALEQERRTGLELPDRKDFLLKTGPRNSRPQPNCTCMIFAPGQVPCKTRL